MNGNVKQISKRFWDNTEGRDEPSDLNVYGTFDLDFEGQPFKIVVFANEELTGFADPHSKIIGVSLNPDILQSLFREISTCVMELDGGFYRNTTKLEKEFVFLVESTKAVDIMDKIHGYYEIARRRLLDFLFVKFQELGSSVDPEITAFFAALEPKQREIAFQICRGC